MARQSYSPEKVVFYMEKQPDKSSFVALDDLVVLDYECQKPIDCNFDNGRICSYSPFGDSTSSKYNFAIFTAPSQDVSLY